LNECFATKSVFEFNIVKNNQFHQHFNSHFLLFWTVAIHCNQYKEKHLSTESTKMATNNFVKDWLRWTLAGAGIVEPPAGLGY